MNKTKEKIIDKLCQNGILNTLFKDQKFGKDFMFDYLSSIDQKDFHIFTHKLVDFIAKQKVNKKTQGISPQPPQPIEEVEK